MEQDQNVIEFVVGWAVENIVGVVIVGVIGAAGAKWWFGKESQKQLDELQRRFDDLERERNGRPRRESTDEAPPESATESPAPQPPQEHVTIDLPTLRPSAPDALLTPKELVDLVAGHTEMAASRMLKPFVGQQYSVRGEIREVTELIESVSVLIQMADGTNVGLVFDMEPYGERLAVLRPGDEISASGLLRNATRFVTLEKCSLVEVSARPRS